MKTANLGARIMALAMLVLAITSAAWAGGPSPVKAYSVTLLDVNLPSNVDGYPQFTAATAINNNGTAIVFANGASYGVSANSLVTPLEFMGVPGYGMRVNDREDFLALGYTGSGAISFVKHADGSTQVYPDLFASGLNRNGVIVGMRYDSDTGPYAVIVSKKGEETIPDLDPTYSTEFINLSSGASDINNRGVVTGWYYVYDNDDIGYGSTWIYSGKTFRDIGSLGGNYSSPSAINALSTVTGISSTDNGDEHAFGWSPTGRHTMLDLGTLGGNFSAGEAVNDYNVIVGQSNVSNDFSIPMHGFVWSSGRMTDLNSLIDARQSMIVTNADGINRSGQITATVMMRDGLYHAALLTPTRRVRKY